MYEAQTPTAGVSAPPASTIVFPSTVTMDLWPCDRLTAPPGVPAM